MAPTNDVQQIMEACISSGTNPFENAASEEWSAILMEPSSSDAMGTCRAFVQSETDSRAALCIDYVLGEHPSRQPEFVLIFAQANCLSFDIHSEIMEGMLQIDPEDEETPFTFCLEGKKGDSILSAPLKVRDRGKILQQITSGIRVLFTL